MLVSDAFDSMTKLINSPPGKLAAGLALAGIVWKFFERVEAVLTEMTKFEIAVWLVGVEPLKAAHRIQNWPKTFLKATDEAFSLKHPSWKGFGRATLTTFLLYLAVCFGFFSVQTSSFDAMMPPELVGHRSIEAAILFSGIVILTTAMMIPLYLSLMASHLFLIGTLRFRHGKTRTVLASAIVFLSFGLGLEVVVNFVFWLLFKLPNALPLPAQYSWYRPNVSFFEFLWRVLSTTTIVDWATYFFTELPLALAGIYFLLLYATAGFILKFARRFDIGFQWFNRKADIEKKPLSAVGLVAGALVALLYWGVAFGLSLMRKL